MSGARRLTSRRHTWHQQQCLDIPRAHAGCFVSRRSPRRMAAATDWVLRWDLCEAVDPRGAEAGRFQNLIFDHFLPAAATATSQVRRQCIEDGNSRFFSTLAARISTHALTHMHTYTHTLERQAFCAHTARQRLPTPSL